MNKKKLFFSNLSKALKLNKNSLAFLNKNKNISKSNLIHRNVNINEDIIMYKLCSYNGRIIKTLPLPDLKKEHSTNNKKIMSSNSLISINRKIGEFIFTKKRSKEIHKKKKKHGSSNKSIK